LELADRVCLVTGAASGIGSAVAWDFAQAGARVALADLHDTEEQVRRIRDSGRDALSIMCDVSCPQSVESAVKEVMEAWEQVDVLVNSAGIAVVKPLVQTSEDEWDRVLDVNLKGVFLCCRAVFPLMASRRSGAIVNIASSLGLVGTTDMCAYCASKGGVIQLTRALALEGAIHGIRVNCVCPGPVDTPFLESALGGGGGLAAEKATMAKRIPLGRLASRADVGSAVRFLASDRSSHITGAILTVDGGETAR